MFAADPQVFAFGPVAQSWNQIFQVITAIEPGWFLESLTTKLAIINVPEGKVCEERLFWQEAIPRSLQPPLLWLKILDNVQGFLDNFASGVQVPSTNRLCT